MKQYNHITIEQYNHRRGVTLLELITTIALLSIVVLAVSNLDLFSHSRVITSDRRAKLQNEISYALEHMTKEISRAVGNRAIVYPNPNHNPINNDAMSGDPAIRAYIDSNATGGPGDGRWGTDGDHWIAYWFHNDTTNPEDYHILYCANCTDGSVCSGCSWEIIGRRIKEFAPTDNNQANYMNVSITARWQPVEENATVDNPEVTLRTRIKMPSVTTH